MSQSRNLLLIVIVAFVVGLIHCRRPSGIIVTVESDMSDIDEIAITVGRDGGSIQERRAALRGPKAVPLPLTLGVEGEDGTDVIVTARAFRRGVMALERSARATIVDGEEKPLVLTLCEACAPPNDPVRATDAGGPGAEDAGRVPAPSSDGGVQCPPGTATTADACVLVPGVGRCQAPLDVSSGAPVRGDFGNGENAQCTIEGSLRDVVLKVFRTGALPPGVSQWRVTVRSTMGAAVTYRKLPQACPGSYEGCARLTDNAAIDTFLLGPNETFAVGGRNGNGNFSLAFSVP